MKMQTIKNHIDQSKKDLEALRLTHGSNEINEAIRNLNMASAYLERDIANINARIEKALAAADPYYPHGDVPVDSLANADTAQAFEEHGDIADLVVLGENADASHE